MSKKTIPTLKFIFRCTSCRSLLLTHKAICKNPRYFLAEDIHCVCPVCHYEDDFHLIEPILGEV